MSLTWKDTSATIGITLIILLTVAMLAGLMDAIDLRWSLGSFAVFLLAGLTGLVTGTDRIMKKTWSSMVLYVLTISALVITAVNAFLNSPVLLVTLTITVTLIWLEFVSVDLMSRGGSAHTHTPMKG